METITKEIEIVTKAENLIKEQASKPLEAEDVTQTSQDTQEEVKV